jgi:hypothetical protein
VISLIYFLTKVLIFAKQTFDICSSQSAQESQESPWAMSRAGLFTSR